jgi:Thiol:disulfide interchange protein
MRSIFHGRRATLLSILLALLAGAQAVLAQSTADLLPVTEAYKLSTDATMPGVLKLHWTIAPDYYLYRGRHEVQGRRWRDAGRSAAARRREAPRRITWVMWKRITTASMPRCRTPSLPVPHD